MSIMNQPTIYKSNTIYKNGAGGGGFINIEIGDRIYKAVKIGTQYWLAENLEFSVAGGGTQKYYTDNQYKHQCGLYYDWTKVQLMENNKQDFFPDGWRVPSRDDFARLKNYLGVESGKKIKAINNSVANNFPSAWGGDNTTNFSAIPAANDINSFEFFGTRAYFWTITEYSATHAYTMLLKNDNDNIIENWNAKTGCMSVRLCKDFSG